MTRIIFIALVAFVALVALFPASAQPPAPKFEVASIRPSTTCGGSGEGGQMKSGPATIVVPSPDRLFRCGPVSMLITIAYLASSAKGSQANPSARLIPNIPVEGGPDWVRSESYAINAKTDRPVSRDMMEGPMMRALLEDRFKLKVHRGSRNGPAYALTVANGGIKLRKSTCTPPAFGPGAPPLPAGATPCPMDGAVRRGSVLAVNRYAKNLSEFSLMLPMDRPVVDRTDVQGLFDFHLEFSPDDTSPFFQSRWQQLPDTAANDPAAGPSIFTALREQLGLKLSPIQAPREFLMIDSIERPSAN